MLDFRPWIEQLSEQQRQDAGDAVREVCIEAQLAAVNLEGDHRDTIDVHLYAGVPDMDAMAALMDNFDAPRTPGSWLAFIGGKPAVEEGRAQIHCLVAEQDSPIPTLFLKARRQPALVDEWGVKAAGPGDDARLAVTALFEWAQKRAQRDAAAPLRLGANIELESGPEWLMEQPRFEEGALRMPVLVTDMELPAPFGGQLYFKLPSPEALLAWALFGPAA